ncbi:ABC transporter B family member 9-like [Magnolia sinica]|uniref:ABC transporter B family member 9-like n=1 Tax=Magnolia sinica TaxID=86752 RepID=UPI00265AF302|nr:ABC transporter B family member 9-like [Magnolia sinica]
MAIGPIKRHMSDQEVSFSSIGRTITSSKGISAIEFIWFVERRPLNDQERFSPSKYLFAGVVDGQKTANDLTTSLKTLKALGEQGWQRSLGQASPSVNAFPAGRATAYKMFETIKRKPEINSYDTSGIVLEDIYSDIELRDVCFSYPARPDIHVFSGFSLHVPSGMTVALVGESGSGKSTVISLLERFYDPQAGEVLIYGINLKKLQLGWIREKIGLVSQESILFTTTIKENIAYGKAGATLEEIRIVTEITNAARFIDKMLQVTCLYSFFLFGKFILLSQRCCGWKARKGRHL